MLESRELNSHFLRTKSIDLGKSRRYSILNRDCEIDGYSAVRLFLDDGIDYNEFCDEIEASFKIKESKLFQGFDLSPRYFVNNINQFLTKIGFSLEDLCSLFKLDIYKARLLLGRGNSFPLSTCLHLEKRTQVCLPLWFSENLDIDSIAKNWLLGAGKKRNLPSRYAVEEGSKTRLFETAVLFVDQELGVSYSNYILSYLQITRDLFSYPDKNISLTLFRDFHKCLRCFDIDDKFFIQMGSESVYLNKISRVDFRQKFDPKNVKELLLKLGVTIAPRLDKTYTYEVVKDNENYVVIESNPRQTGKLLGSYETALYRFGHIAYIPTFFDFSEISIEKSFFDYDEASDVATFTYHI